MPRFCSQQCVYKRGDQKQLRKGFTDLTCWFPGCSKPLSGGRMFCSRTCSNLHRHGAKDKSGKVIIKTCPECSKRWETRRNDPGRQRLTCSDECEFEARSRAHRGKITSIETKEKLSLSHTGKSLSDDHRYSIGRGVSGSRNSRWVDGRSCEKKGSEDYNFEFSSALKTTIKKRDRFKCRKCNEDGSKFRLFVHHIDYNKKNNSIDNLVTVCASCHSRIHGRTLDNEFKALTIVST